VETALLALTKKMLAKPEPANKEKKIVRRNETSVKFDDLGTTQESSCC
jgi:hypothetical protein